MKGSKKITIRGIVIPETWNDAGEVETLSIVTYTEQKYLVADNENARNLSRILRKRIVAEGVLTIDGKKHTIEIKRFHQDDSIPGGNDPYTLTCTESE